MEVSFNQMHKQLDEVAMGSSLRPALANIFFGFLESRLFDNNAKPSVCFDMVFGFQLECGHFLENLNSLHPAVKFFSREGVKQLL